MTMRWLIPLLLLAGCAKAPPPVLPPAPALASVTFVWTPAENRCEWYAAPCTGEQEITCDPSVGVVRLPLDASTATISLPPGKAFCALVEYWWVQEYQYSDFDLSWAGPVRPGAQTAALRLEVR